MALVSQTAFRNIGELSFAAAASLPSVSPTGEDDASRRPTLACQAVAPALIKAVPIALGGLPYIYVSLGFVFYPIFIFI